MHLTAARGIKRSAIEHNGVSALVLERLNDTSVEVVEKRIAVIEAVGRQLFLSPERSEGSL